MTAQDDASAFIPRAVTEEPVREIARHRLRTACLVFRAADGFEVAIPERLLERAVVIGRAQAPLEWLGQLVGVRGHDGEGSHLLLDAIVRDTGARCEPHFVTSTLESEARTRALAREQYPASVVVGWIHGHVRHGARYSRHDFKNQATWTDPDSIGVVIDPWDPELLAVYRGPRGERLTLVRSPEGDAPAGAPEPPCSPTTPPAPRRPRRRGAGGGRFRALSRTVLRTFAAGAVVAWMAHTELRLAAIEPQGSAATVRSATRVLSREARVHVRRDAASEGAADAGVDACHDGGPSADVSGEVRAADASPDALSGRASADAHPTKNVTPRRNDRPTRGMNPPETTR